MNKITTPLAGASAEQLLLNLQSALARPYIFVHVNKCGGTSVSTALNLPKIHGSVQTWIENFGLDFVASKKAFSVVRRPYERMCSLYRYRRARGVLDVAGTPIALNEWVHQVLVVKDPAFVKNPKMMQPARQWMLDHAGKDRVELVVRLEDGDAAWSQIQRFTGSDAALPRLNTTAGDATTTTDALSAESKAAIERHFEVDFATYSYDRA